MFLALFPYGYYGIGDLIVYREWTALPGWPYLDYWVEYPPLFPFTSEILYRITGGQEFLYDFLLALLLALAGAVTLYFFHETARLLHGTQNGNFRALILFGVMATLPYTWWYADPIPLVFMMAAIWAILKHKDFSAGIWIGLGMLAKWFPLFLLPALFRQRPAKKILLIGSISFLMVGAVFITLYATSPAMTRASLMAQPGRTSWQTIWALIDGNLTTGAYLTTEQRLDASQSNAMSGNPPVISPLITFFVFGATGIGLLLRRRQASDLAFVSNSGIVWALFLLWSPGWSSQWVLYLLPLILLTFPISKGILFCLGLVIVNMIEFPFLLGRQMTETLWVLIPIRTLAIIMVLFYWVRENEITNEDPAGREDQPSQK